MRHTGQLSTSSLPFEPRPLGCLSFSWLGSMYLAQLDRLACTMTWLWLAVCILAINHLNDIFILNSLYSWEHHSLDFWKSAGKQNITRKFHSDQNFPPGYSSCYLPLWDKISAQNGACWWRTFEGDRIIWVFCMHLLCWCDCDWLVVRPAKGFLA